jgi:hypothetical protein
MFHIFQAGVLYTLLSWGGNQKKFRILRKKGNWRSP